MLIFWQKAEEVEKCLRSALDAECCEGALATFTSLEMLVAWRWFEYRIHPLVPALLQEQWLQRCNWDVL